MKSKKLLFALAIIGSAFALSSCTDELENIVPEDPITTTTDATVGTGGEDAPPMD